VSWLPPGASGLAPLLRDNRRQVAVPMTTTPNLLRYRHRCVYAACFAAPEGSGRRRNTRTPTRIAIQQLLPPAVDLARLWQWRRVPYPSAITSNTTDTLALSFLFVNGSSQWRQKASFPRGGRCCSVAAVQRGETYPLAFAGVSRSGENRQRSRPGFLFSLWCQSVKGPPQPLALVLADVSRLASRHYRCQPYPPTYRLTSIEGNSKLDRPTIERDHPPGRSC
jgi:hypothetical protein